MTALPLAPPISPPTIAWDLVVIGIGLAILAAKALDNATKDKSDEKPDSETQECPREEGAKAPGKPTAEDGYVPPKRGPGSDGKPVKNPNGQGKGWLDDQGRVWVPTGPGPKAHGGPHWDVQLPNGGHQNVYPGGRIR